jgi:hypothetical protein
MYDLFISYSSEDRQWARKLYDDLRTSFPTLKIFWDYQEIPAGGAWRTFLTDANMMARNFVFLWSNSAKASNYVLDERATFNAARALNPEVEGSRRLRPIGILLEGSFAPNEDVQSFPGLASYYRSADTDRGVSNLTGAAAALEWNRVIRFIGDACLDARGMQRIIAAIAAVRTSYVAMMDATRTFPQTVSGPSLDEFLNRYGLDWDQVRGWYGADAREWRPFGGTRTITELLDDLRVQANTRLNRADWFQWDPVDLTTLFRPGPTPSESLLKQPSIVILDQVSLFHPVIANAFKALKKYAEDEKSVLVSLSPVAEMGADWLSEALRIQATPLLDDYFQPSIPPLTKFANCVLNLGRIESIERLIRGRIAVMHLKNKEAEAQKVTGLGT